MNLNFIITLLFSVISTLAGIYLFHFLPEYETEENKIAKQAVQKYTVIAFLLSISVALFYVFLYKNNTVMENIKTLTVLAILYPAAFYDFQFFRIPNKIIAFAVGIRVILLIPETVIRKEKVLNICLNALITAAIVFAICFVCNLIMKNAIGMGDVKLLAVMALYLGSGKLFTAVMLTLIVAFIESVRDGKIKKMSFRLPRLF